MSPVISPLARLGLDERLARHVRSAMAEYRTHGLVPAGVSVPGFDALLAFLTNVVDIGGQLRPLRGESSDTGGVSRGYLLPIGDAASLGGVSVKTLRRRIADGSLNEVRVGRRQYIEPIELLRFIGAGAS